MEKILKNYDIVKMNRNSLTLKDKTSEETVFITRTLFNNMENIEEIRIVERTEFGSSKWIEGRIWSRF